MPDTSNLKTKLAELKLRTNRDLVAILRRDLESALAFLASVHDPMNADRRCEEGEATLARVRSLLPLVAGASEIELAGLKLRVLHLRAALDHLECGQKRKVLSACG